MNSKTQQEVDALQLSLKDTDVIIVDGWQTVTRDGEAGYGECKAVFRASSFTETELRTLVDDLAARRALLVSRITDADREEAKRIGSFSATVG